LGARGDHAEEDDRAPSRGPRARKAGVPCAIRESDEARRDGTAAAAGHRPAAAVASPKDDGLVPGVDLRDAGARVPARAVLVPPGAPSGQQAAGGRVGADPLDDPAAAARPLAGEALAVHEPVPPDGRVRAERSIVLPSHCGSMTTRAVPPLL